MTWPVGQSNQMRISRGIDQYNYNLVHNFQTCFRRSLLSNCFIRRNLIHKSNTQRASFHVSPQSHSLKTAFSISASRQDQNSEHSLGIVIVDHGSKKKSSNDMLFEFVDMYKKTTGRTNVQAAHMEIARPSISEAISTCISNGATRIVIAPYFLSRGRHIQDDIPLLVEEAKKEYPNIECVIAEPIGVDPLMAQLIENRVQSSLL